MDNIYELIMEYCVKFDITGAKLCDDLGFSRSFLTNLKKGRCKSMTYETAKRVADYFKVTVDELFGNEPEQNKVEEIRDELFEKRKILFDLSEKVSEEDLDRVIKIMEAFKKDDE